MAKKIVRATSTVNEFGRYDNTKETISPVNQVQTVHSVAGSVASVTTVNTQTDTLPATPPAVAQGTQVEVRIEPTEFSGLARTTETVRTKTDQSVGPYASEKTTQYSATLEIIDGSASVPTLGGQYGSLIYERDAFKGLYVGRKRVVTYHPDGSQEQQAVWSDRSNITKVVIEKQRYPASSGQGYRWRKLTYTFDIRYFGTSGNAISFQSNGLEGSYWKHVQGNQFEACRVKSVVADAWDEGDLSVTL